MTELERLLEQYPGTHVAWFDGCPSLSLTDVDLHKCTAWVVNGGWSFEWSDNATFCRNGNRLECLGGLPKDFRIEVVHELAG